MPRSTATEEPTHRGKDGQRVISYSQVGKPQRASKKRPRFDPKSINDGFDDPEQAAQTLKQMWQDGRQRMYPLIEQWVTNALYFRGRQHVTFDSPGQFNYTWYDPAEKDPPDRIRINCNLMQKHALSWIARMTAANPDISCYPTTNDDDDKDRADLWNGVNAWQGRRLRMKRKLRDLMFNVAIMGNGFLLADFEENAGPYENPLSRMKAGDLEAYKDPDYVKSLKGVGAERIARFLNGESGMGDLNRMGLFSARVVPPYEITIPDIYPRNDEEVRHVIWSQIVPMQWLRETYYDHPRIDDVKPGMDYAGQQLWFVRRAVSDALHGIGAFSGFYDEGSRSPEKQTDESGEQVDARDTVIFHTYYAEPTRKHPEGLKICMVNDIVLEPYPDRWDEDLRLPHKHLEIPLTHFFHTADGVNYWGTCDVEQAIDVQTELNRTIAQIIESRNRTANPILIAEQGHGIEFDDVLMVSGELLEPRRGRAIYYLEPPSLPTYVGQLIDVLEQKMESIFAHHKPSQGVSKAGDSGRKVRLLQAADEMLFAPFADAFSDAYERFWLQMMCLIVEYEDTEQIGYVVGEDNERSYFRFTRDQLVGPMPEGLDSFKVNPMDLQIQMLKQQVDLEVRLVPGKSPQTIREDLRMLTELGFIQAGNQQHEKFLMNMLGYGHNMNQIIAQRRRAIASAAFENDNLVDFGMIHPGESSDDPFAPSIYDDHDAHIDTHKRFTKTRRFRELEPEMKAVLMRHIEAHEVFRAFIASGMRDQYLLQEALSESDEQIGPLLSQGAGPGVQQSGNAERPRPTEPGSAPRGNGQSASRNGRGVSAKM